MRRGVLFGVAFGTVIIVAAGCGGGNTEKSGSSTPTAGGTSGQTVTINESEFKLDPSTTNVSKAGTVTFKIVNKGAVDHALEVEGNGVEEKSSTIGAGESTTITVDLPKAGSYEFYCPVNGHKDKGMEGTLTVSGGSPATSGGATTEGGGGNSGGGYGD
jgi:uncharacterized cupredoxin-like copper-binding protein